MDTVSAPEDLRLRLGDEPAGVVLAERLDVRRSWRLSPAAAAVVVSAFGGRPHHELVDAAADTLGIAAERVRSVIAELIAQGLLEIGSPSSPTAVFRAWRASGWSAAADHVRATWDYPFVDYDAAGWRQDRERMQRYDDQAADRSVWEHERCAGLAGQPLPGTEAALDALSAKPGARVAPRALTSGELDILLAVTFGRLAPHRGAGKARRTSPSGGARHPVEGYVFVLDVAGRQPGIWHVRGRWPELVRLAELPPSKWLEANLSGACRAPWAPAAIVVFSAVFGRTMYRYREPRTLRSVFLDVGHATATLEAAGCARGLRSHTHHGMDDAAVEAALGLEALAEGVVSSTALTGGGPT